MTDFSLFAWASPDESLVRHLRQLSRQSLDSYKANPTLVEEQANMEVDIAEGGYGKRQLFELIQNGADAMVGCPAGRIHVLLTERFLYCANEGAPIDAKGMDAILRAYLSVKRADEIGRFGLGFKSVLGVSDKPEFFCRPVSFGFDARVATEQIRDIVPNAERYPVLRVAQEMDPVKQADQDPDLRALMSWAMAVVRLERNIGDSAWLHEDIKGFPPQFLLFCPTVSTLVLEDRVRGVLREITIERAGEEYRLLEGGEASQWRVFSHAHSPSAAAKKDAGKLADRDRLPVLWALPTDGGAGLGRFWAFFPLADHTTLSGVVNAPWKTNDDRTNLLEGDFNRELLAVVADLVVRNLSRVSKEGDPAWHLDIMPARGREARSWADDILTSLVYDQAAKAPCLPDQTGGLRAPSELKLHPRGIPPELLQVWASEPSRPGDWCHPSVETKDRRARTERLLELAGRKADSVSDWMQALSDGRTPNTFRGSIRVAAELLRSVPAFEEGIRRSWMLIDDHGNVAQAVQGRIFLPPADGTPSSDRIRLVHPDLSKDKSLHESLATLGVVPVTPELELGFLLDEGLAGWRDREWDLFWSLVRRAEPEAAATIIIKAPNHRSRLKVRTMAGSYVSLHFTLLPGPIVPADGSRDRDVTIDDRHHQDEMEVLLKVGAVPAPAPEHGLVEGGVFRRYRAECVEEYVRRLEKGSPQPQDDKLAFSRAKFAGPLEPLGALSEEGRRLFTEALLNAERDLSDWVLSHLTQHRYPKHGFTHPVLWAIQREGRLPTSLGPRPVEQCVGPALHRFDGILPVARCAPEAAERLKLPSDASAFKKTHWAVGFAQADSVTADDLLGLFYAEAARQSKPPGPSIRCRVGHDHQHEACDSVTVVSTKRELDALIPIRRPVVFASSDDAQLLIERWGLRPAEKSVRTELSHVSSGAAGPLLDRFPALRLRVDPDRVSQYELVACSELRLETLTEVGKTVEPVSIHVDGHVVYWLDTLSDAELLDLVSDRLALDLSAQDRDAVLKEKAAQRHRERIATVRRIPDAAGKLLAAVGVDAVRRHLPVELVQAVEAKRGPLTDRHAADLASAIYGINLLQKFGPDLEAAGFDPPQRWAGSRTAVHFVKQLGFEPEYAGSEDERLPEVLKVDGPTRLPDLHEFQAAITHNIKRLVHSTDKRRGLLSLPTGAGKTRVVVQALIEELREEFLNGPVLWIAQSEELCEQAVRAWADVWHALGPKRRLYVCRLWSQNEAESFDRESQVVVATIHKVGNCVGSTDYEWLAKASCVVIDEAHSATEPSYTKVLEWQGITRGKARCPLIGLTATPFRGRSEEETERLVQRFGRTRLDEDLGDDPYAHFQKLGVLARVKHQLLSGVRVDLSPKELDEVKTFQRLPASVYAKIAGDVVRNTQLVDDILSKPRDWPMIVFAASVEHAQALAALLLMEGVVAAPISATTDPGTRRHYVERFRENRIQVLTNYGVLTQGFDAPAVRAIYVARPTFSPTLYQQMIGRGLRGPLNGGKEECLIVNIEDNFERYGTKLAFRDFEHLWSGRG